MDILEEHKAMLKKDTFGEHLGVEVIRVEGDTATVSMPFEDKHKNGMGNAHGGAIFGLADLAFATASHAYRNKIVNAQSSISYLSAGTEGPLKAIAKPIKFGKTLIVYDVEIFDAKKLIAKATITGYMLGNKA